MAERSTSGTDDRMSPHSQNFEHGIVSSDAVYVPHSKQSGRGRRGRGKSSGNFRHGQQQQNDSVDRPEFDEWKRSEAHSEYSGRRGQKPFRPRSRGHYYDRRNVRRTAYESRQFPEGGEALFGDSNYCSESNVASHAASFDVSAGTYNGVHHTHDDGTEFNAPSSHVRQHAGNSRVPRKAHNDHRYEERSQKRGVDHQPGHRGRYAYHRGRGNRGASSYFGDEKFTTVSTQDESVQNSHGVDAVDGFEADHRSIIEFTNSCRRNSSSEAHSKSDGQQKLESERSTLKDDRYPVRKSATASQGGNCIADDLPFQSLRVSTHLPNNVANRAGNEAVFNVRMKRTDPEFESQRGSVLFSNLKCM